MTAQRLERLAGPHDQRNQERFTGAGPSPRTQQHCQDPPPLQQDSLPHERLDVLCSVAISLAPTSQNESTAAGATVPAVVLGRLNGPTTVQALSDDPLTEKWNFGLGRDHIVPVLTNDVHREYAAELAPRQENHRAGPSRKHKRDQLQGPSTATTGLDSLVSGGHNSDTLVSAPKRPRPSIKADISNAEVARELARMHARFGSPVYGPVDIRDRIGTRAKAPKRAPALAPRRRRKGEAEVLEASMNKGESETYRQQTSTAGAAMADTTMAVEEPRRRLRSTRIRNLRV